MMHSHIRKVELLLAPSLFKLHHAGRLKNYLRNNPAVINPLPRTVLYRVLLIRALALMHPFKHILNKYKCIELCSVLLAVRIQELCRVLLFSKAAGEKLDTAGVCRIDSPQIL